MATQSIVKAGQKDIVREGAFDLTPHSLNEAFQLAELMAKSDLVPQGFKGRPADVLIAVQYGAELGLPPLQALSGICVINGRACVWGDAALAVVLKSGLMENYKEMTTEEIEKAGKAVFWCKRKGTPEPIVREFSVEDAKRAHLWDNSSKKPIWHDYPFRMLQMRARSWALRDGFSDALKGIAIREEVDDYVQTDAPAALAMPRRMSERKIEASAHETAAVDHDRDIPRQTATPDSRDSEPKCGKCGGPLKYIPDGIAKSGKNAGKPYSAFWICSADKYSIKDYEWKQQAGQMEPAASYAEGSDPDPFTEQREPGQEG